MNGKIRRTKKYVGRPKRNVCIAEKINTKKANMYNSPKTRIQFDEPTERTKP
ncbi:hypothetical protein GCM10008111_19790 [Alishewanella tabrizica]|uniref:Uncharacterized protein n=1 Tax=Alishewanella tabrizica TaxID=671278 RepID=A0ABQ2WPN1_9ALTE|nr:hypothetical protein GCM10008111_19790 [Alishewanella tabrizica]